MSETEAHVESMKDCISRTLSAMDKLPAHQSGIVLGAGFLGPEWKKRGWTTLDIRPEEKADITGNAIDLDKLVPPLFTRLSYG